VLLVGEVDDCEGGGLKLFLATPLVGGVAFAVGDL
jgi:hypothetical protein